MARGRKPKLRVVGDDEAAAGPGHNSVLTDDQRQALTRRHGSKYWELLAAKKEADAALKNHAKVIKSDLGDNGLLTIKLIKQLETDDGEQKFRAEMEAKAAAARWCGLPIGAQGNLFDEDRRPVDERAFEEGKSAGFAGKDPKPPYGPGEAYDAFMRGWHEAQAVLAQGFTKTPDAPLLRSTEASEESGTDEFDSAADGE
jgi:ribosome modulation factor